MTLNSTVEVISICRERYTGVEKGVETQGSQLDFGLEVQLHRKLKVPFPTERFGNYDPRPNTRVYEQEM